ncbi:hypothetical protein QVD17_40291 [Tagetes erecta]|uniref:Protein MIZU-KUSSEI 1 n=1 Tax=Tagetes erecta TaxID=13708 RepID=A0AAD8NAN8_TARER|nr:hypothetical protein QVD17_40291 [Tagetes erecta]
MNHRLSPLSRTSSCDSTTAIIPSNYTSSSSINHKPLSTTHSAIGCSPRFLNISTFLRSILSNVISIPTNIQLSLSPSPCRKVTGTLFGNRRGHVSFAVQHDPRSNPILIIELAISTSTLVKEMSSGLVRIALECEKQTRGKNSNNNSNNSNSLFNERKWSMYCNGRKCGYALRRECSESEWHVLRTVQTVSVGAGVIPLVEDGKRKGEGECVYMRARFERVVGSRDSEAFYMINPDASGGPELSIFLLRI